MFTYKEVLSKEYCIVHHEMLIHKNMIYNFSVETLIGIKKIYYKHQKDQDHLYQLI